MDPHSSAQDVHRCDLCETAIIHSYCDFCHVNLCKPCIGEHISDGYDKHKIVPFQERRSTFFYSKCKIHTHKNCKFQCKDCDIVLCSSCMASEQHSGHIFVEVVSKEYEEKKKLIENDKTHLKRISPMYAITASNLKDTLAELDEEYEQLTSEITRHGEKWHREIDKIIDKMKYETSEMKKEHRDILKKHLYEIERKQPLLKQALLDIKKIQKSNELSQTIEYKSKIEEFSLSLILNREKLPTLKTDPIDHEKLCSSFGYITPLSKTTEKNTY